MVIVTGAGRGIGEATARAFALEDARLVVASRTRSELEQVAASIRADGGEVRVVPTDMSLQEDVERLVRAALRAFGQVDVLVNCAGVYGPIGLAWEVDAAEWVRAMNVNLCGTFFACRAVVPHMVQRRKGKVINFSGGGATAPLPRFSCYGVSKAAVVRLTETLAEELKEYNIQINAIAPGAVNTRLQDEVLAAGERAGDLFERIRRLRESGEGGVSPQLAADLAIFLASEESDGLTGKLVAAPYDDWRSWDSDRIRELAALPWLTLRRMDPFTLRQFVDNR